MSMIIGGASVALVESKHGGMNCEAYPSRLALVLAVIDSGALGVTGIGYGSDEHKDALAIVAQQVAQTQAHIAKREERDAHIKSVGGPWIKQAAARYMEREELGEEDAMSAATSLFWLIANDTDGDMPDAAKAVDDDIATWYA